MDFLDLVAYFIASISWLFIVCPVVGEHFGGRFIRYIDSIILGAGLQIAIFLIVLIMHAIVWAFGRIF